MPRTLLHPLTTRSLSPLHGSWVREDDGELGSQAVSQDARLPGSAVAELLPSAALPAPVQGAPVPALPRSAGPAMLAFDGSPGARRLVAETATLLGGVPAVVVCVWWRIDPSALLAGGRIPGVLPPPPQLREEHEGVAEQAAWSRAADGAALAAEAGLEARPLAVAAEPRASLADALAAAAAELDASVLVVAERRRPWPARLLGRSPARELVDLLPCPVLVVPDPQRPGGQPLAAGAGRADASAS